MYTELLGSALRLGIAGPGEDGETLSVDRPSANAVATSWRVTRRSEDPSGCGYSWMICFAG
jgi:hypothetical protein